MNNITVFSFIIPNGVHGNASDENYNFNRDIGHFYKFSIPELLPDKYKNDNITKFLLLLYCLMSNSLIKKDGLERFFLKKKLIPTGFSYTEAFDFFEKILFPELMHAMNSNGNYIAGFYSMIECSRLPYIDKRFLRKLTEMKK